MKLFAGNKIAEHGPLKVHLSVFEQMLIPTDDTKVGCREIMKTLTTEPSDDKINEMVDLMNNTINIFSTCGRGFVVDHQKIEFLDISIYKFNPMRGSSYIATSAALVVNNILLKTQKTMITNVLPTQSL